ncbi:MAG TPA: Maf family protein [Candidatus Dormibacteraeota bacterium]|nr:Maf family protein [Candidatus Dormibacteraeota bacterium]
MPSRSIVLVSASPRRADLLRRAGLEFTIRPSEVDETPFPGEAPGVLAERLARAKVLALPALSFPALAIGADTVVAVADAVLGKPKDRAEARQMLRQLSGRVHEVTTAMALRTLPEETIQCERAVSRVTFAPLSDREIDWYAGTGEGMDKAGAYALQGIGALFIESIAGSYTNVIGLPLDRLYPHLRLHGVLPALS